MQYTVDVRATVLEINGHRFALQVSDGDVMQLCEEIWERSFSTKMQSDSILAFEQYAVEQLDRALGRGAVESVLDGAPVTFRFCLDMANVVSKAAAESYGRYILERYLVNA